MKPVDFAAVNAVLAKDQPQYQPLPTCRTSCGIVTSCWAMTWRERLRALFTGRVYVSQMTFGSPLQPLRVTVEEDYPID